MTDKVYGLGSLVESHPDVERLREEKVNGAVVRLYQYPCEVDEAYPLKPLFIVVAWDSVSIYTEKKRVKPVTNVFLQVKSANRGFDRSVKRYRKIIEG